MPRNENKPTTSSDRPARAPTTMPTIGPEPKAGGGDERSESGAPWESVGVGMVVGVGVGEVPLERLPVGVGSGDGKDEVGMSALGVKAGVSVVEGVGESEKKDEFACGAVDGVVNAESVIECEPDDEGVAVGEPVDVV